MNTIPIDLLLPALKTKKRGWLREAFEGEAPDFVQEHDKLCTAIIFVSKGFGVTFPVPVQLEAGQGYVFEEDS